jgi:RNA-directed DNA polymerase
MVGPDLAKFFDRVNHQQRMAKIAERVSDKSLLKLIRALLRGHGRKTDLCRPGFASSEDVENM